MVHNIEKKMNSATVWSWRVMVNIWLEQSLQRAVKESES